MNESEDKIIITVDLPDEPATISRSLVLRYLPDESHPWAVHYRDRSNGDKFKSKGYFQGGYFATQEEAMAEFQSRLQRELDKYNPWIQKFFGLRDLVFRLKGDIHETLVNSEIIEKR